MVHVNPQRQIANHDAYERHKMDLENPQSQPHHVFGNFTKYEQVLYKQTKILHFVDNTFICFVRGTGY